MSRARCHPSWRWRCERDQRDGMQVALDRVDHLFGAAQAETPELEVEGTAAADEQEVRADCRFAAALPLQLQFGGVSVQWVHWGSGK